MNLLFRGWTLDDAVFINLQVFELLLHHSVWNLPTGLCIYALS